MTIVYITAKCSDCCCIGFNGIENYGYVPDIPGIGCDFEDYVVLKIENDTGKIIGWKPLTVESFKKACGIEEIEEEA